MESNDDGCVGSSASDQPFELRVEAGHKGVRLDQFLSYYFSEVSRTLISCSIRNELVFVDGLSRKSSYRLKPGHVVRGSFQAPPPLDIIPEKIDFPVLYEDDYLLLLSKPPGLVVHPGSGNFSGTLVNGLVYYCQSISKVGEDLRPGIVHRLDKDTSGVMVVAKTNSAHRMLVECFKNRLLTKEYIALLHGVLKDKTGRIVSAIGRHPVNRQKMCVRAVGGRHAVSNWEVIAEFGGKFSLVKVQIETGRTHQIRVHMAHLGCPVAGDSTYGSGRDNALFARQMLHASRLKFEHPISGEILDLTAPVWTDFANKVGSLGRLYPVEGQS